MGCCMKLKNFVQQPLSLCQRYCYKRPFHRCAVPLPRVARGRLGVWHLSFPRQNGGSGERSEPIGAFVQPLFLCGEMM